MTTDVAETLRQRGARYGRFDIHANRTQEIKRAMEEGTNWKILQPDQRESLEMIAHKIGRILEGDADYADSWHDIAGYAKLVEDRLVGVDSNASGQHSSDTTPPEMGWLDEPCSVPMIVFDRDPNGGHIG